MGPVIDTANSTIAATDKRIESLLCDLNDILRDLHLSVHVKRIATVAGKIIALSNCVENVTRLMSKNLCSLINSTSAWSDYVQLFKTGQNVPRELIKRWNVTNSTGLAPINIFKAINADSTIMYASFAVKPTATRLKRVSLLDGSSFPFLQRHNHQAFTKPLASLPLPFGYCNRLHH